MNKKQPIISTFPTTLILAMTLRVLAKFIRMTGRRMMNIHENADTLNLVSASKN
jgi:hypothetical protein